MLAMMADDLVNAGYRFGHMSTAQGMVVNTSERGSLGYSMYTLEGGNEIAYATIDIDGVFCSATFTAFGMGSDYGYSIDSNGKKLYRHLYFDVRTGEFADILMSATIISHDNDIVENVYQSIIMNTLRTEEFVASYAASLEKSGRIVSYIFQSASLPAAVSVSANFCETTAVQMWSCSPSARSSGGILSRWFVRERRL